MKHVYDSVASELRQIIGIDRTLPIRDILKIVMNKVKEVMPYDGLKTESISRQYNGDMLVGLSTFINEHAGVCRHQGLLAAYIIENLIREGLMTGAVGVERNTVKEIGGTHAWAVFKTKVDEDEELFVVDPAQSFVGTKAEALNEGRWKYRLNSDK